MKTDYVYILKCSDGTYYTGFTSNLEQRFIAHKGGKHKDSYTYSRRPLSLAYYAEFTDPGLGIATEKQIKNGLRRKRKL